MNLYKVYLGRTQKGKVLVTKVFADIVSIKDGTLLFSKKSSNPLHIPEIVVGFRAWMRFEKVDEDVKSK